MPTGRAVVVTLAVALAGVILVLVLALSDEDVHLAGTNNAFDQFPVGEVRPGDELCEQLETVPEDAAAVRVYVEPGSPAAGGRLSVLVRKEGRTVSRGERTGGWPGGPVDVPIATVPRTVREAEVCLANGDDDHTFTLRGHGVEPARLGFTLRGDQVDSQVRLTYLRAEPESWWSMAGTVAHRFGIGRGELFGGWIPFAWLLGVLAMCVVAVRLVLREATR
jgi:hypothetical protein